MPLAPEAEALEQADRAFVVWIDAGHEAVQTHALEGEVHDRRERLAHQASSPVCRRQVVADLGPEVLADQAPGTGRADQAPGLGLPAKPPADAPARLELFAP